MFEQMIASFRRSIIENKQKTVEIHNHKDGVLKVVDSISTDFFCSQSNLIRAINPEIADLMNLAKGLAGSFDFGNVEEQNIIGDMNFNDTNTVES